MVLPRPSATALRVGALSVVLLGAGVALLMLPLGRTLHPPGSMRLPLLALLLLSALFEAVVLNVQVRREAYAVSMSELAVVLGLFFTTPGEFVLARVLGPALVLLVSRRLVVMKTIFNVSLFVAEAAVGLTVFRLVRGDDAAVDPRAWAAAMLSTLAGAVLTATAVTLAIALVERSLTWRQLSTEICQGGLNAAWVTTVALVAVHALDDDPLAGVPLLACTALLLAGFRAYGTLAERHLSLERLHRFSQAVSSTPEVDEILADVLTHARDVLHAEYAEVVFVTSEQGHQPLRICQDERDGEGGPLRRDRLGEDDAADPTWLNVVRDGTPLLLRRDTRGSLNTRGSRNTRAPQPARDFLARRDQHEAVLAPIRGDAGIVGTIMVGDRMGDVRSFDEDDVQLLVTVANHAGMALQNGRLVDRLRHDALHDRLTGLPNRTLLQREALAALADHRAGTSPGVALLMLDLRDFKQINDTFGLVLGDQLLVQVGARLSAVLEGRGIPGRLGGDEFGVVLPRIGDAASALAIAATLRETFERPITIEGVGVEVGVSIGVAVAPLHGLDAQTLLKHADAAMYDARNNGTGVQLYEDGLDGEQTPQRLAMVAELRHGIQRGELELYVQPQASVRTGRVVGVEALARWRHPEHGLLFPDTFIPIAERSGLIKQLTDEMLEQSLAAAGRWRRDGAPLSIAVNLSARSPLTDELVDDVQARLRRHGVPPESLTLEITESSVIHDQARTAETLAKLHDLGVRLSIDDFGTGYSSLSYLRQLPVQEVKVDKSFVMTMLTQPEDAAIVRSVISLGRNLDLEVVAEGVEDAETWEALDRMSCTLVQGYYLAAPMPAREFKSWLDAREGRMALRG